MTAQVLFFNDFPEKDPHLNAVEFRVSVISKIFSMRICINSIYLYLTLPDLKDMKLTIESLFYIVLHFNS